VYPPTIFFDIPVGEYTHPTSYFASNISWKKSCIA
jgi:hypothetical protein